MMKKSKAAVAKLKAVTKKLSAKKSASKMLSSWSKLAKRKKK